MENIYVYNNIINTYIILKVCDGIKIITILITLSPFHHHLQLFRYSWVLQYLSFHNIVPIYICSFMVLIVVWYDKLISNSLSILFFNQRQFALAKNIYANVCVCVILPVCSSLTGKYDVLILLANMTRCYERTLCKL